MYEKFYGLSEKPFELTPDPKFLYVTPSYQKALASIADGIKDQKRFISITGEVGTGKTTLVHSLLNNLDEKVKSAFIFHTTITFKDLLKIILQELGLVVTREGTAGLLHQLIEHLTQITARGERVAIIIDEAQDLPLKVLEEIQMFCNLQTRLAQFVLVGQPELEDILNSEALRQLQQSIEIRCQLKALNEEESKEYIDHRLRLVGSGSLEVFTQEAISMICSYARGIPRMLNVLCDNALLKGYSLSKKKIGGDILLEVMKEIEGPGSKKVALSSSATANRFRSFLWPNVSVKKVFLAVLIILCLSGLLLSIRGYLSRKPTDTWDIESIKNSHVDAEPPSSATIPPIAPTLPIAVVSGEKKVKQIVTVKEKQTISYLAQKYYGTFNKTVVDFILDFNPEITNVDLILVDQKIKIPLITEELLIIPSPGPAYKIHAGTFQTPDVARLYRDEPELKEKKVEILTRQVSPRETWYRVIIGTFNDQGDVLKMIHLLKEKNLLPAFGGLPGTD